MLLLLCAGIQAAQWECGSGRSSRPCARSPLSSPACKLQLLRRHELGMWNQYPPRPSSTRELLSPTLQFSTVDDQCRLNTSSMSNLPAEFSIAAIGLHSLVSPAGNKESETGVEQSHAEEQYDEGRSLSVGANQESDTNSDELDKGYSGEHDSNIKLNNEQSVSDTDTLSSSDAAPDDDNTGNNGDFSGVSLLEHVDQGTLGKEEEGEELGKPPPPIGDMTSESVELAGQLSGENAETPSSLTQEECQSNENPSLKSLTVCSSKESKPSMSQVKNAGPELLEFDEHGNEEMVKSEEEYVKKGFMCGGDADEEDEELREYWTRAIQTSTSTGEIVEEIVKVLKHKQKTHDLLCPVCGSCVTRRVILRKRKRSSLISVERWYRDPLDEGEVQEEGALPDVAEVEREEQPDTEDIEAFGCLSCFSLFINKGRQLLNQLQEIGPDTFNCLPFFFPPYPWGMTQMNPRSAGYQTVVLSSEVADEIPTLDEQDASSMVVAPDFTCGIGSALLPDYPWGTTHFISKGKPSDQTEIAAEGGPNVEQQREGIDGSSDEERSGICGLAPAIIPAYPWGVCRKQIRGLEDAGAHSQSEEGAQPLISESTCTCGIAQALFPEYQWGYLTKAEDMEAGPKDARSVSSEDSNLQIVSHSEISDTVPLSQPEISDAVPQLEREERSCTCGLIPALIPNYPWGLTGRVKDTVENETDTQAKTVQETEGKEAEDKTSSCDLTSALLPDYPWGMTSESQDISEDTSNFRKKRESEHIGMSFLQNGAHMRIGSAVLPSYPWGKCSVHQSVHVEHGRLQPDQDAVDRDCICGLGLAMLPEFPWGQSLSKAKSKQHSKISSQEVKNYIEQETKIEACITSKTDVFTVTSTKMSYSGQKPPQNIKTMIPQETSHTIQHVKLDQMVTVIDASVKVDETAGIKGPPLASLPSTGFALLDFGDEGLRGKERIETKPSTGYAHLEEFIEEKDITISEIEEDPPLLKRTRSKTKPDRTWQSAPQESYYKPEKIRPQTPPTSGTQFPSFEWSVGKLDAGDLTTPLLKASIEPETETFVSVLKPSPVNVDQPKSDNWISVFKVSKPSDDGGLGVPLLSPASAYIEEIEEVKRPISHPQIQADVTEAVIDVPPSDSGGTSVGAIVATAPDLATTKKERDEWDILKAIVYGGLDISIASLGVTSSAAGGNAITRTVVYMGLATLFSGFIAFYHNVLNLYHYHKDYYIDVVGVTLMLHGTVALISYIVFGLLAPLVYAFSYRVTDDRDDKFILCCGVTIVAVTALALGKAKVSNKRYLRTLFAYLSGGVLAAIIGYLTGEHVAELLEEWGI
ncbi:hypothetical protein GOP47_0011344 [Adiantum capillus-veneris]|uniref:Uncharacterized protein n=1 Tax=Adiantum capillus-veneris TaxID=13818 RepID=A0A9D4ZHS1_ADICA|nr:hypothetical protein GOP47_0011344 [Adiantum capillus-veneris]